MDQKMIDLRIYELCKDWLVLNGFVCSSEDEKLFTLGTSAVSMEPFDQEGNLSFCITYIKDNQLLRMFTGNLEIPALLGWLMWLGILTIFKKMN